MRYFFSLVLPVQNQEEIIESVVKKIIAVLEKTKINYEVVMVENGSKDKTLKKLKELARINKRIKVTVSKSGYGQAVVHGLNRARGKYIGYMPSDGQCDAQVLPKVVKEIKKSEVDLVKVFRVSRESALRKYISKAFNLLANLLFNLKVIDINGSPTVFARSELNKLDLQANDSFLDTELLVKAKYLNWNIVRVSMRNFKREGGKSTVKPSIVMEFLKNMYDWRLANKFKTWKNAVK